MIKKITTIVKQNKKALGHRALILGGTFVGAFIVGALYTKNEAPLVEGILISEETIIDPETETSPEQ